MKILELNTTNYAQIEFKIEYYNSLPINISRIGFIGEIKSNNLNILILLTVFKLIEMSLIKYEDASNLD